MGLKHLMYLSIVSCVACFCGNEPDDLNLNCTEEFVYGLTVTLINAETSQVITQNVSITAIDDDYQEQLMLQPGSQSFIGAGERPGLYMLEITSTEYEPVIIEDIFLDFDGCHVIPQSFTIELQPL